MNIGNLFLDVGPADKGGMLVVGSAIREAASNAGPLAGIKDVDIHGAYIAKSINDDAVDPIRGAVNQLNELVKRLMPGEALTASDVVSLGMITIALNQFTDEVEYDATLRTVKTRSKDRRTHEDQKETDR